MADTSSNVQFKVENGLLVLGTANIAGPAVFNGNVDINGTYLSVAANLQSNIIPTNNTYSIGNSTSRWILNAMTGNFVGAVTVTNTVASGNTTITGFANVSSTLAAGNTTVTGFVNVSSTANVGGATTLRDTLTVNGAVTISNTLAVGNSTITGFANVVGTSATFNALTGVANTTDFITTSTAHGFSDGDLVRYIVAAGNTAVGGLANATNYYVVSSNSTAFKLSASQGGSAIDLTAGVTETGHTLTPQRVSLSAAGNIESPIGLANVGSLRVLGAASITGAATVNGVFTVNNTAAVGSTTVTGFINVSSTANVGGATNLRGVLDVNGAVTIANTLAVGNTSITGFINVSSTANVGGATTLRGTLTVNGATTIANTLDVGNTTITGFANIVGSSATFNASTGVAAATDVITTQAAHGFSDGDLVRYIVAAGNTAIGGLANATNYYVIASNSTAFKLSATYGGTAIDLTAGTAETGHTLTPQRIRFSTAGNIDTSLGLANVASLRVLGTAVVNGAVTLASTLGVTGATTLSSTLAAGNTTITGFANISSNLIVGGNATFDTDLVFIDGTNNRIGFKNTAPASDLISINGNTVITSANAAIRFLTSNATHNAHVSLAGNTTNTRLTVTTYEANATASDGGFLFQSVNSTATTAVLQFNQAEFKYKSGNVAHSGNFGIYDVNGTRLGP